MKAPSCKSVVFTLLQNWVFVLLFSVSVGFLVFVVLSALHPDECKDSSVPAGGCFHKNHVIVVENGVALCRCKK